VGLDFFKNLCYRKKVKYEKLGEKFYFYFSPLEVLYSNVEVRYFFEDYKISKLLTGFVDFFDIFSTT